MRWSMVRDSWRLALSGLVDREYYEAQTGLSFHTPLGVARHYLRQGADASLSVHPLFEAEFLARRQQLSGNPLLDYLDREEHSPHPLFHLPTARKALRRAGLRPEPGVWSAWVRAANSKTSLPLRDSTRELSWGDFRRAVIAAASRHRGLAPHAEPAATGEPVAPDSPQTSLVASPSTDLRSVLALAAMTLAAPSQELVVVGALTRSQFCVLTAYGLLCRVLVVNTEADVSLAQRWNTGGKLATGSNLVFIAAGAKVTVEALDQLTAALADQRVAITQPLYERADMTIRSAGAYFAPNEVGPTPLLARHATADAAGFDRQPIPAVLSSVVAIRRSTWLSLGHFEPAFDHELAATDLSMRAAETGAGIALLVGSAQVTTATPGGDQDGARLLLRARHTAAPKGSAELLSSAGFVVSGHEESDGASLPLLAPKATGLRALPRLRWTIDTPVTSGWWASAWGDWHFAHSLASALQRLGQHVSVDTRAARSRPTRSHDDVLLVLRGLDAVAPPPGAVNLLWVLYGADEVSAEEARAYSRVFAASTLWAGKQSAAWGISIESLLQCTDPASFNPDRAEAGDHSRVLFVGNARRGSTRPMVAAALDAGTELSVYGTGWESTAPAPRVVAQRVANAELGRLYASAEIVLNDHREDMRRAGFMSNRLFDAVACGARVLSDPVAGLDEVFDGCVQSCEASRAGELLALPPDEVWPSRAHRLAVAARIRADHSFDKRAKVLLEAAIEVLRQREQEADA